MKRQPKSTPPEDRLPGRVRMGAARAAELGVILPASRIAAESRRGFWQNRIATDYLDEAVALYPDRTAIADVNSMTGACTVLSNAELRRRADRIALGLVALGVRPGDVVSFQLPNWWEFMAIVLACVRIGAITHPVMPIYRHKELAFMLGLAESRVFIVPRRFRDFDYPAMAEELRADLPALQHVLVVGGAGAASFEDVLLHNPRATERDAAAIFDQRRPGPNDVMQLLYTSGTTGEPKGVMHTANTLMGSLAEFGKRLTLDHGDVVFMASPFAHQIGYLYGIMTALMHHAPVITLDIWDPAKAAQLIEKWRATYTLASTPFLADLTDLPGLDGCDIGSLQHFVCGGAPIPRSLARRAARNLGTKIVAVWGMTENGAATGTYPDDPEAKVFGTDGVALAGMEVRVVDDAGKIVAAGQAGVVQTRGAANFVGYLKRPDLFDTDADGWFDTGDLATMDEDGYIRIVGRNKDVIIRGGLNIPVVEVEDLLYRHPAIQDVAIVGMPHERLGECACAFAVLSPGHALSLEDAVAFLKTHKIATQYLPERLEIIDRLPRTPSGKVQKFRLREIAANLTTQTGRAGAADR
jgi:cyclohexanecarboxylate-CoA ligase